MRTMTPASRSRAIPGCLLAILACGLISGCERVDPGIEEEQMRMRALLRTRDRELAAAQKQIAALEEKQRSPAATAASAKDVESRLSQALRELRTELESMPGVKILAVETSDLVGPGTAATFGTSLRIVTESPQGRAFRMEIPITASQDGKWTLPQADKLATRLAETTTTAPASAPQPTQPSAPLRSVMQSDQTIVVDWGDAEPSGQQQMQTLPTQQDAPQESPSASRPMVAPMQADQEIIIDFGD